MTSHERQSNLCEYVFLNANYFILVQISLKFVRKAPINNKPVLIQLMAWHLAGDKPLSEPLMT